jgi:hypothetical protein
MRESRYLAAGAASHRAPAAPVERTYDAAATTEQTAMIAAVLLILCLFPRAA